jgi:hypothetical protein
LAEAAVTRAFVVTLFRSGGNYSLFEAVPVDAPVHVVVASGTRKELGSLEECVIEFDRLTHSGDTLRFAGFAGGMCLVKL